MSVPKANQLHIGASYYPEHWPESRWAEDIRLMREAGMTVMRMAEFAWSTLEPSEGEFCFNWLDRAIDALATEGIASVLGTPTAGPPAWLVEKYPDLLAVGEDGRRVQFGNRCHYCVNSPDLHAATQRIVSALAERFGPNPHIIGWQIDNEYNRVCTCERCQKLFQQYLNDKFGTLDQLNDAWTTPYWSQTYSAWEQIPIPIGPHNPGLMLEFKRFITDSYCRFQKLQIDCLRSHVSPDVWITHNFMGWYEGYDHYVMAGDLDMASWDWYVGTGHHDYLKSGATHDLTRGFKRRNFWLIETQPGAVNWTQLNNMLNKGEARVMAWHAVAHGADAVMYWQWRSALGGQEQYHGTLIDQSGQPRPFFEEVKHLASDFEKVSSLLAGSEPQSQVAMLNSYDSRWSVNWQRHHGDFDYVANFVHYYQPLAACNIGVDIISADAPLTGYKLVVAPALVLIDETQADLLTRFVERGGHLVLTQRCGMKDTYNRLLPLRQPGLLADIAGVEVEDYYALVDPIPVQGNWFSGESRVWAERLKILDAVHTSAIARYGSANGWLDSQIAVAVHAYGKGLVYYVGAYLNEEAQQALMDRIVKTAVVRPILETPQGVEAQRRVTPDGLHVWLVMNHERSEQTIALPWLAHEHLTDQDGISNVDLGPYDVAVLTRVQ